MSPLITSFLAQAASTAASTAGADASAQQQPFSFGTMLVYLALFAAMFYFALIRPQAQAKKKQEEKIGAAKTGDKVVTSSGIHGIITNVKENTVILRIADNVKIEIEKTHIDKVTRPDSDSDKPDKAPAKS